MDFQFRGPTPLPGSGGGVRYSSSHPQLVAVSPGGLVYPLAETGATEVSISVEYPGLPAVHVPVSVDPTRSVVALEVDPDSLDAAGRWVLPRLRRAFPLPPVLGVLDDGTRVEIASQLPLAIEPAESAMGIVEVNEREGASAMIAIPDAAPVTLNVYLRNRPELRTELPVVARDALPEITLLLPPTATVDTRLQITPRAYDDVGIAAIDFFLDDHPIGTRSSAPFDLALDLDESMRNTTIRIRVEAIDTAGQRSAPAIATVRVVEAVEGTAPSLTIESPAPLGRYVERAPIRYEAARPVSDPSEPSGIEWVDFVVDGRPVAAARYPIYENRGTAAVPLWFEVWRDDAMVEPTSTRETTRSVQAIAHATGGATSTTPGTLFVVLQNQSPLVVIREPVSGGEVVAGQLLPVTVEVADDVLSAGVETELLLDGRLLERAMLRSAEATNASRALARTTHVFYVNVPEERVGTSIRLLARGTDTHGVEAQSSEVSLVVRGDRPPTVALTHPIEGSRHVAGSVIELRADGTDDLGIRRVDFYVGGQLVGSDSSSPFATLYESIAGATREQILDIHAVATDGRGATARSETVRVSLTRDEQPPVVNVVSPAVRRVAGNEMLADVVEDTEVVLRVSGHDDVGVSSLRVRGVARSAEGWVLTGNLADEMPPDQLRPEVIPGALRAFTALRLIRIPAFEGRTGDYDPRPIEVEATDEAGNRSVAAVTIAVRDDERPEVTLVRSARERYLATEIAHVSVQASDDAGVRTVRLRGFVGESTTVVVDETVELTPARSASHTFAIDLAGLDLPGPTATLRLEAVATDTKGQTSDAREARIVVDADTSPPLASIYAPASGSELFRTDRASFSWRASDESALRSVRIAIQGGAILVDRSFGAERTSVASGEFTVVVPDREGDLVLELRAEDEARNVVTTTWRYPLVRDQPPSIRIRTPPPGTRLVEGEPFTLTAVVTDNRAVHAVSFFIEEGEHTIFEHAFSAQEIADRIAAGGEFSVGMRAPHRPETGEPAVRVGVRASDGVTPPTIELAELNYLDDLEAPLIRVDEPADSLFDVRPGQVLSFVAEAEDNVWIESITAVLNDPDGGRASLAWIQPVRRDRVETRRVPNPDSLGSQIVGTRFFAELEARVELPADLREGETYELSLVVADRGVNVTESPPFRLRVVPDRVAPLVRFLAPQRVEIESQQVQGKLELRDDVALASVRVTDGSGAVLADESLDGRQREVTFPVLVPAYVPDGENRLELRALARDAAGNETREVVVVEVLPDQGPRFELVDALPRDEVARGGLLFQTLRASDDHVGTNARLRAFGLLTSLSGTGSDDASPRLATGETYADGDALGPEIQLDYPEATHVGARIEVDDTPVLQTIAGGRLAVRPWPANGRRLRAAIEGRHVPLRAVVTRACNACGCTDIEETVTASAAEGLDLGEIGGAQRAIVATVESSEPGLAWLSAIHLDATDFEGIRAYTSAGRSRAVRPPDVTPTFELADGGSDSGRAVLSSLPELWSSGAESVEAASVSRVPSGAVANALHVLGHAVDRFSDRRPTAELVALASWPVRPDLEAPSVEIVAPASGTNVVPGERLAVRVAARDGSRQVRTLTLLGDDRSPIGRVSLPYDVTEHTFVWEVPIGIAGGQIELTAVAEDASGNAGSTDVALPIQRNLPPGLEYQRFASEPASNGDFTQTITSIARLNLGEFWVPRGSDFAVTFRAFDDAGLERFELVRLDAAGQRIGDAVFVQELGTDCPIAARRSASPTARIRFDEAGATQYAAIVTDSLGQQSERRFFVHPLENVIPEVRIVTPANDALVAAGTFRILVGVLATDDRYVDPGSIEVYANGLRLSGQLAGSLETSPAFDQKLDEIYDALEERYGAEIAARYGTRTAPHLVTRQLALEVPPGVFGGSEPVSLSAVVRDSTGAIGRDAIRLIVAPDDIRPEVAVVSPPVGFGPHERTDFPLEFRAYDNVKVESIELSTAFGVRDAAGTYRRGDYGAPLRRVSGIEARDFEPLSTVNVDTPVYRQAIIVPRIAEIASLFPDVEVREGVRFDVWVRLIARDAAGNSREREISYPIRIDERPVVDFLTPVTNARVVEGSSLSVSVNAFDDVGIDSVRLIVTHGTSGAQIYNEVLRAAPFAYSVPVPAYDVADPDQNRLILTVEAIDGYGAATGDLDQHRAIETTSVEIVVDQPPVVAIGLPRDGDAITEGEALLVQINALDDVGIERVELLVTGLLGGDRTLVDTSYPYEFLVDVPYGQAGRDLLLDAVAVEYRREGSPRAVRTPSSTRVHVDRDTEAPSLTVLAPAVSGATAVEQRELRFAAEVLDDVRVSSVEVALLVDRNGDGELGADEEVALRFLTRPPYAGAFRVGTLEEYLGEGTAADEAALGVRFRALDGAGNCSEALRVATLVRNHPPQVESIQLLDSRGFSLGSSVSEVTEGRGIVVNVVATDREAGVDSVRLFWAVGDETPRESFPLFGEDVAAPFQFHLRVPTGRTGEPLRFWADATDVDGRRSEPSALRTVTIGRDQPPTARIVTPRPDAAVIDGEDVIVAVEARDDLGSEGIDRVVFYLDGVPAFTAYDSIATLDGVAGQESVYRAVLHPPRGTPGFELFAVAYDVLGQSGRTATITIGTVEDTVAPDVDVLSPADGDVLTAGEIVPLVVSLRDIGSIADRVVSVLAVRERQDPSSGVWAEVARIEVDSLALDDASSDPENHTYVYRGAFADNAVLRRDTAADERVVIQTTVTTENHTVVERTTHEVGLPIARRLYASPRDPVAEPHWQATSQRPYYGASARFQSPTRTGALVAAWST